MLPVNWRTLSRAKVAVAVVVIAAAIYNIPRFFEREVVINTAPCTGRLVPHTRKTSFRTDRHYFLAYKTICYFVFRAVGPLTALVVLNARLIRALRNVRAKRRHLRQKVKHRENLTTMLVVVVSVFIVCQLPDLGIRVAFTCAEFASSGGVHTPVRLDIVALRYANAASNALLTLNSAVNFFVYCLVSRKFRRILIYEMCRNGGRDVPLQLQQADTSETEVTPHHHFIHHYRHHQEQQQQLPQSQRRHLNIYPLSQRERLHVTATE